MATIGKRKSLYLEKSFHLDSDTHETPDSLTVLDEDIFAYSGPEIQSEPLNSPSLMKMFAHICLPLVYDWPILSSLGCIYAIVTAPIIFCLGLTIPVVHEHYLTFSDGYMTVVQDIIDVSAVPTHVEETSYKLDLDMCLHAPVVIVQLGLAPLIAMICLQGK